MGHPSTVCYPVGAEETVVTMEAEEENLNNALQSPRGAASRLTRGNGMRRRDGEEKGTPVGT